MRRLPVVGACLLGALLASHPADAGVDVGAEAPNFKAEHTYNSDPITIADLGGRLILLELFSTT